MTVLLRDPYRGPHPPLHTLPHSLYPVRVTLPFIRLMIIHISLSATRLSNFISSRYSFFQVLEVDSVSSRRIVEFVPESIDTVLQHQPHCPSPSRRWSSLSQPLRGPHHRLPSSNHLHLHLALRLH